MRSFLATLLAAVVFFALTANATDVEGDVWGTWTRENSPYNVIGEIRVPPGSTLVIEPGILVDFKGHYKFIVDSLATLLAIGTEIDSIFFTTEDTATGWHGIRFLYADSNCLVTFCRLEYGKASGDYPHPDSRGGAIYCDYSNPTITNNTISSNSTTGDMGGGGGIYCWFSRPLISENLIAGNSSWSGGGISGCGSTPIIASNVITGNYGVYGGGISCSSFSPNIVDNVIVGNWAGDGGGIYCNGTPTITGNFISGNGAYIGAGIECFSSQPTISYNIICNNRGSGIGCLWGGSPDLSHNTISRNVEGIHCQYYCDLIISSTIIWENTGRELALRTGSSATVTYSDIQGGWEGEGNINADPLFVGPEREDFYLRWRSPCIDAGVPDSLDPDGTRSDMGAFYFNQDVPGIVELYPHDTPIVIPRGGGELSFDGWVFNFSGQSGRADIWTYLFAPELGRYGPLDLFNVRIPADSLGLNQISRHVPEVAPEGDYAFVAYVGDYPSTIIDSSYFYFTKEGEMVGVTGDWTEDNLPLDYALFQNYPNPFNATTRINYQLPVDAHVKLEVYNLLGQKVATLVDSKQQTGYKSVVWDASEVSSGLYFYKLTADDFTETKRMMLVK